MPRITPKGVIGTGKGTLKGGIQGRIYRALELLTTNPHKLKVRHALMQEFDISRATADRDIDAAKKLARHLSEKDAAEKVAELNNVLYSIATNGEARDIDRVKACNSLMDLHGLAAPQQVALTDPTGKESWQPINPAKLAESLVDRIQQLAVEKQEALPAPAAQPLVIEATVTPDKQPVAEPKEEEQPDQDEIDQLLAELEQC